jgi:hypothetical protein
MSMNIWEWDWVKEVRQLYVRSVNMEVDEFEALLDVAIRGGTPKHPDLPLFSPFATETILR